MKALAVCMLLLGCIAFWSGRPDREQREKAQAQSLAVNYGIFRNAVFAHAHSTKAEGVFLPDSPALTLPSGWVSVRAWRGVVHQQEGQLFCYVYGPARPEEVVAIQEAFRGSAAVGWNNNGFFARNGDPMPLPEMIPDGAIVSAVRID